jgi:hypothetical protein
LDVDNVGDLFCQIWAGALKLNLRLITFFQLASGRCRCRQGDQLVGTGNIGNDPEREPVRLEVDPPDGALPQRQLTLQASVGHRTSSQSQKT